MSMGPGTALNRPELVVPEKPGQPGLKCNVETKVNEQYDSDASMAFYEYVMGGGGDDIHYGIFNKKSDGLRESSQNSVEALAAMAVAVHGLKPSRKDGAEPQRVLDLGSGKGGSARYLAKTYGCYVTCFNLGEKQNEFNMAKATSDGIGHLIEIHLGSFNEKLPAAWTDRYDLVWSQEAFCHAMDQEALMAEVQRVLKPGGTVVFSDIMQSDVGGDCSSFTGQNATAKLASPQTYKDAIKNTGMKLAEYKDLTHHLTKYFQLMLRAIKESKLPLQLRGVSITRLEAYEEDLVTRFDAVKQRAFAWGMFAAQNMFSSDALLNGAFNASGQCPDQIEACINEQYDSEASMEFYKYAMGGGTDYCHYGVFNSPSDDLATATHNTVLLLSELARRCSSLGLGFGGNVRVLDLGSGKGAAARHLAAKFGCHVTCYNLGRNQNAHNLAEAEASGIGNLVDAVLGNFNNGLPAEWTASFDVVWSQESLCHAKDQRQVLGEVMRVLKPGGVVIFTDIMRTMLSAANLNSLDSAPSGTSSQDISDHPTLGVATRKPSIADSLDSASRSPTHSSRLAETPSHSSADKPGAPTSPHASTATDAIPITSSAAGISRIKSVNGLSPSSVASSYGASMCTATDTAPQDFMMTAGKAAASDADAVTETPSKGVLHVTSPSMYIHSLQAVGLELIDFRDLSKHLSQFYDAMVDELTINEAELVAAGISQGRLDAARVDLQHRISASQHGALSWGAFTARKPSNASTLVVGAGPVGSCVAMRLSQSGVANVTLKVLPSAAPEVVGMVRLAGVTVIEDWEDVGRTHWGSVIVAVKTHWLPAIALEMSSFEVTFENLCMAYNGYTQTPEYFSSLRSCRAVVPQSFAFNPDGFLAWDIKYGNTYNPWNLPCGKASQSFVGQLRQSGINAQCDPSFHRAAFFKFCVNNAANLLSVIKTKNCKGLVEDPACVDIMRSILTETFDVLELDPFYAALVPMHRAGFIEDVIFSAKGSVASYSEHYPSSHQHYAAKQLVDTRALNGFVVRKARELSAPAPINEYITRQVVSISTATVSGIPRNQWDLRVKLSACKRLIESMGMGTSVWGHATARTYEDPNKMLLAPFGESFGHATASNLHLTPMHPDDLSPEEVVTTNVTAIVLHGGVYAARPDVRCVLHTHSPYCTAMACSTMKFNEEIVQDSMQFVGRVGYLDFGGVADDTAEMDEVAKVIKDADVLFLRNHGVIVVGEDVERAFSRLWYLERTCQTQLLVHAAGAKVYPAGKAGVQHTVEWNEHSGSESAHKEWEAHVKDLLHSEVACGARAKPFWYE